MPTECPDLNLLQCLLDGRLAGNDLAGVEKHVEDCSICERRLEQLTDQMSPVDWRQFDQQPAADAKTIAFLSRVRAARPPRKSEAASEQSDEEVGTPADKFPQPDLLGQTLPAVFGSFELIEQLGEGGMGVVYRARESVLKRDVALKLLAPRLARELEYRERFLREARAMAAVQNDHIVDVYQVGEFTGRPYVTMPLLEGETLRDRLRREKSLGLLESLRVAAQIAAGLAAAHDRGLIHRDVKPANIWLETPNDRVKLLDFGLAHIADDSMEITASGAVQGTPQYMSPEQALARDVDHRTDLYSLGCVLYQMLTGTLPTEGATVTALLIALTTEDARDIREVAPELPEPVSRLVMALLERNPADRPETAALVAQQLSDLASSARRSEGAGQPADFPDFPPDRLVSDADRMRTLSASADGTTDSSGDGWRRVLRRWGAAAVVSALAVLVLAAFMLASMADRSPDPQTEVLSDQRQPVGLQDDSFDASGGAETSGSVSAANVAGMAAASPALAADESAWITVFDGESLDGWTVHGPDDWTAKAGVLKAEGPGVGWLMLDREFNDYVLEFEYRLPEGGASGLFPRAWPNAQINGREFIEIQILDDAAPAFEQLPAREKTGSLFSIVAPDPAPQASAGEWNRMRITVRDTRISVAVNGVEVLNHDVALLPTGTRRFPEKNRAPGHIGFQYYRTKVEFRDIRVRDLSETPRMDAQHEPPPLDKWLQGRERLTVSRIRPARFQSIQAALKALKPGQVVEVLDSGPYHENLQRQNVPPDTGLISTAHTVVSVPNRVDVKNAGVYAHWLSATGNFRISGFEFRDHPENVSIAAQATMRLECGPGVVTVEDCAWLSTPLPDQNYLKGTLNLMGRMQGDGDSVVLRDCWIRGRIYCAGNVMKKRLLTRNVFDAYPAHCLVINDPSAETIVRQNVFRALSQLTVGGTSATGSLTMLQNTFLNAGPCLDCRLWSEMYTVTLMKNVSSVPAVFAGGIQNQMAAAARSWTREQNIYLRQGEKTRHLPLAPSERVASQLVLSDNPDRSDFARVAARVDRSVASGLQEAGAVQLLSVPERGDWLTRLLNRWRTAGQIR